MKPAPFEYCAPRSLEETLELLAQHGSDAKLLAGGQSLVPTMNFRLARPAVLIDLNGVTELSYVEGDGVGLRLGAMTRQRTLERHPLVMAHAPLLCETMPHIAHPQIRNRGTLGGSLAHADPAAELPAVALVLEAELRLRRLGGERTLPARDFFTGLFATALEPDELLVEVLVPAPSRRIGWAFREVSRRHGDYALVGVAALLELDPEGRCGEARIALLSVGEGPVFARAACKRLAGHSLAGQDSTVKGTLAEIAEAARLASEIDIDPPGDLHASPAFRRHLARVLTERALRSAVERAAQVMPR